MPNAKPRQKRDWASALLEPDADPDLLDVALAIDEVPSIDRPLVQAALQKVPCGIKPSAREMEALRRAIKGFKNRQIERLYEAMTTDAYAAMAARSRAEILDDANLVGLPADGETVHLPALLDRIHTCLEAATPTHLRPAIR